MSRSFLRRELGNVLESFAAADRAYLRSPRLRYVFLALAGLVLVVALGFLDDWTRLLSSDFWGTLLIVNLPFRVAAWSWYLSRSNLVRFFAVGVIVWSEVDFGLLILVQMFTPKKHGLSGEMLALLGGSIMYYAFAVLAFLCALSDCYGVRNQRFG